MSDSEYGLLVRGFNSVTTQRYKDYKSVREAMRPEIAYVYDAYSLSQYEKVPVGDDHKNDWDELIDRGRTLFGLSATGLVPF